MVNAFKDDLHFAYLIEPPILMTEMVRIKEKACGFWKILFFFVQVEDRIQLSMINYQGG